MTTTDLQNRMANRARILAKVQALMRMTTENGASEAEAANAAEHVNRLMAEHDLTFSDCAHEVRGYQYGEQVRSFATVGKSGRRSAHDAIKLAGTIGSYWDCIATFKRDGSISFFGTTDDAENAHYMLSMIRSAMDREYGYYRIKRRREAGKITRSTKSNFMTGMVVRLAARIDELKKARSQSSTASTALVVIKSNTIKDEFQAYTTANKIKTKEHKPKMSVTDQHAAHAGYQAGGLIDLAGKPRRAIDN